MTVADPIAADDTAEKLDARYLNIARLIDVTSIPGSGTYDPDTQRIGLNDSDTNNNMASASAAPTLLEIDKSPDTGTITGTTSHTVWK